MRYLADPDVTLLHGDAVECLRTLPDESVHMCVTSPPFYGLRDYGTGRWEGGDTDCDHMKPASFDHAHTGGRSGNAYGTPPGANKDKARVYGAVCGKCGARRVDQQIGLEETPEQWVESLVAVFREVRRVLRRDGTLWVEVGDSYVAAQGLDANGEPRMPASPTRKQSTPAPKRYGEMERGRSERPSGGGSRIPRGYGYKPKDLVGGPWLLAFALRADGWYLRSEIIWSKPNPMPESVSDRPTTAHSRIFLFAKQPRYFFDAEAVREPLDRPDLLGAKRLKGVAGLEGQRGDVGRYSDYANPAGRNVRSVWEIATQPFPEAHFATFPQALVRRCILAGCPEGGTVLDPFVGSGTSCFVARKLGRRAIGIDLNAGYLEMASRRLAQQSLFAVSS